MRKFSKHKILSAPVMDGKRKNYLGFVDVSDLLASFCQGI
jgi:hypothetical protein